MLSYAAEFPVGEVSSDEFLAVIEKWILGSPYTTLKKEDFFSLKEKERFFVGRDGNYLDILKIPFRGEDNCGVKHVVRSDGVDWITLCVFSRNDSESWVSVRIYRESSGLAVELPEAKKPVLVRLLLSEIGGGQDGDLVVSSFPHEVSEVDIERVARLLSGRGGCRLPIIYVSRSFSGHLRVDARKLAARLDGMAHVVVEPSRAFSIKLKMALNSRNAYGGGVGIYWPDDHLQETLFDVRDFEGESGMRAEINLCVRNALLHRRPDYKLTWSYLNELLSREIQETLKASGSHAVMEYINAFDDHIRSKDEEIEFAEKEIERLKAELRKFSAMRGQDGYGVFLKLASEQDFYHAEIRDIVLDALTNAAQNVQSGGRREHVLRDIVSSNGKEGGAETRRERLKVTLQNYRNMDAGCRRDLENLGFSIGEDGKHFKLIYNEDGRYTFALPKTGSDYRGGLNAVSDIAKRIF